MIRYDGSDIVASCLPLTGQIPEKAGTRTIKTEGAGNGAPCDDTTLSIIDCTAVDLPQCGADNPDNPDETYDVGVCETDGADCTWQGIYGTRPGEQSQQKWVYANNRD
eukprot:457957-Pyramimonas_sp.AAC.1